MPDTTGPRSNRNPILRAFRRQVTKWPAETADLVDLAQYWAGRVTAATVEEDVPGASLVWLMDATVSQQVFAARVLYRYAAVFGGAS